MIESYFLEVETVLQAFSNIRTYVLKKKVYNSSQGYIGRSIFFENGHQLDFIEVKHVDFADKIKYRYQYMDEEQSLIFRYDNAPHHKHIATFPHHKHTPIGIIACAEPTLRDVLFKIAQIIHK
ncbi:MAG: hypothetical protein HF973_14375 [Chloroflexi bacterium]|nr:hypothetical protein [Chloroflexota bacterium]